VPDAARLIELGDVHAATGSLGPAGVLTDLDDETEDRGRVAPRR
jgi:hypothetical protein